MKKVISLSVYGDDQRYYDGAIANSWRAPAIYPGWIVRIYCPQRYAASMQKRAYPSTEIWEASDPPGTYGMFWRFQAADDPEVETVIFRDADSILGEREAAAVAEWIKDDTQFHVMRDHPDHAHWPMLGGMWGCRGSANAVEFNMKELVVSWGVWDKMLDDMRFLNAKIWPMAIKNMTHHSSVQTLHPGAKPFPASDQTEGFVGEIVWPNVDIVNGDPKTVKITATHQEKG